MAACQNGDADDVRVRHIVENLVFFLKYIK
jgi:hypothetical protein